ncbi:unnamed protein product [Phytomonas sp. Hart1]|nr:unnamed protein product [Phytomonas sp. Hart1]|eukprot:CCW70591.1 unnamed protein product [Phytomonas sp. isolate Hart1]
MAPSRSWVSLSDNELQKELQSIFSQLSAKATNPSNRQSDEWEQRLSALQGLQECARADLSQRHNFTQLMSSLFKLSLLEQLEDRRSRIVRAACAVIRDFVLYSSNRAGCAMMSTWYVPTLLRLTGCTVTLISDAAKEVLRTILSSSGYSIEAFSQLLKSCCARQAGVRAHALEMLAMVLQQAKGTSQQLPIAHYAAPIRRVIRDGLLEGDSRVRQAARTGYWAFFAMDPDDAEMLLRSLPPSVWTALDDAKALAFHHIGAVQPTERGAPEGPSDPQDDPSTAGGKGVSISARKVFTGRQDNLPFEAEAPVEGPKGGEAEVSRALCEDLRTVAARKARALVLRRDAARQLRRPLHLPSRRPSDPRHAPLKTFSAGKEGFFETQLAEGAHAADGLDGERWRRRSDATSLGLTPERRTVLNQLLASSDWRERLEAIQELEHLYAHLEDEMLEECVKEMVCHMDDPHFRVREAALEFFVRLPNQLCVDWLRHFMAETVSVLIMNTNSTKSSIKCMSRQLLAHFIMASKAEAIVDVFFHCVASASTVNIRKRAIEALQFLFVRHFRYFWNPKVMTRTLPILIRQLSYEEKRGIAKNGGGCEDIVSVFSTLYAVAPGPFVSAVRRLDEKMRGILCEALQKVLPDLEGECAADEAVPRNHFSEKEGLSREDLVPPPFRAYLKGSRSSAHHGMPNPNARTDIPENRSPKTWKRRDSPRLIGPLKTANAPMSSNDLPPPAEAFRTADGAYPRGNGGMDAKPCRRDPAPVGTPSARNVAGRGSMDLLYSPFSLQHWVDPCEELREAVPELEAEEAVRRRGDPLRPPSPPPRTRSWWSCSAARSFSSAARRWRGCTPPSTPRTRPSSGAATRRPPRGFSPWWSSTARRPSSRTTACGAAALAFCRPSSGGLFCGPLSRGG